MKLKAKSKSCTNLTLAKVTEITKDWDNHLYIMEIEEKHPDVTLVRIFAITQAYGWGGKRVEDIVVWINKVVTPKITWQQINKLISEFSWQ